MKVLIATFRYLSLTGTETFTYTLLQSLARQKGIDLFFYSPFLSAKLISKTKKLHLKMTDKLEKFKRVNFDVCQSNHNLISVLLRYYFPQTPILSFMHGKLEFLDKPPFFLESNYYAGISEETCNELKKYGIKKDKIFYFPNSVNTRRFKPNNELPIWPKKVLVISNRIYKKAFKIVKKAVRELNLSLKFVGKNKQKFQIEKEIQQADIIMSLGRGIIEAMSCGKAALVFSNDELHKYGDGMVTSQNVDLIAKNNFSGRSRKIIFNKENLIKELKKYQPQMGNFNRQYVLKHFKIETNVKKLISIYQKVAQEKAGKYDRKIVNFMAQGIQQILDYEKLALHYKDLKKILFTRFKDQLISR